MNGKPSRILKKTSDSRTCRKLAQRFGDCIAGCEVSAASSLLAEEARSTITPEAIQSAVATMTSYSGGSIQVAQVLEEFSLENWPGKQAGDLAVVSVALSGESFSGAVPLTMARDGDTVLIRHLESGRT